MGRYKAELHYEIVSVKRQIAGAQYPGVFQENAQMISDHVALIFHEAVQAVQEE